MFDGFLLLVRFKILRVEHLLRQRLKRVRNVVVSVLSDVVHREVEDNWNTPSSISNFADSGTPSRALALRPRASGTCACGSARASASRSFGSFASPKPTEGIATTPIIVNHAATVSSLIIALLLLASMINT